MGYVGKEAVEEAEAELDKRRHERELEMRQTAGNNYLLLSFVPSSLCALLFLIPFLQHA
jgi:hypothetical protein